MPYVLHSRSASAPTSSVITFSNDHGPGAHTPLHGLPRLKSAAKKSLFHIPNDDPSPPSSPLPATPTDDPSESPSESPQDPPESPPDPPDPPPDTTSVPFPRSSPTELTRTSSASSIILPNGKPLKSSLKSSSSSTTSIPDDDLPPRHARSQSMPSTPAFGPKNVHFKEKDEGLETVRVFRRTGRPLAVSTPQGDDTETETEAEHFPFPLMSSPSAPSPLMEIDPDPVRTSPIPPLHPPSDSKIHLESISLPPARPPVLRGTVLVRNLAFEKHVGVRFTLDDWTTVSEVLGTYAGPVFEHEALAGQARKREMTVGDLVGILSATSISDTPVPKQAWDRFTFTIRLEDYEPRLGERTLWLVARFAAPGVGEWWDNNGGANFRVGFRPRSPPSPPRATPATFAPTQPPRPRGASAPAAHPSAAPFLRSMAAPAHPPPRAPHRPHGFAHAPRRASPPPAPSTSASAPQPPSPRLHLRHYAAPSRAVHAGPPSPTGSVGGSPPPPRSVIIGGQPATRTESEDERERPLLRLTLSPPSPTIEDAEHAPLASTREAARDAVLSPLPGMGSMPFGSAPVPEVGPSDSSYAAFLREWCFAQGPSTRAGPVLGPELGREGKMGWVGGI